MAYVDNSKKRKILIASLFGITEEGLSLMRQVAQVTLAKDESDAALLAEVRDANTILVGPSHHVTRSLIESASGLRHIARVGVGVDRVDVQAATERGVFVTNAPDVTADSVAEFTMALLLALSKNIPRCDRAVKEGKWTERPQLMKDNIELNGKTHGIVGLGRIGRRVAVRCKAFGMRVIYFDSMYRDYESEKNLGIEYVPFATLLKESDSISLHVPLTDETNHLFSRPQFAAMKKTALLINQARGKVVNEADLVEALQENKIGGYGTDDFENEPPDPNSKLLGFKNVVAAPHLGGITRESQLRVSLIVAEDVVKVMRGDVPKNLVNPEVLKRTST